MILPKTCSVFQLGMTTEKMIKSSKIQNSFTELTFSEVLAGCFPKRWEFIKNQLIKPIRFGTRSSLQNGQQHFGTIGSETSSSEKDDNAFIQKFRELQLLEKLEFQTDSFSTNIWEKYTNFTAILAGNNLIWRKLEKMNMTSNFLRRLRLFRKQNFQVWTFKGKFLALWRLRVLF